MRLWSGVGQRGHEEYEDGEERFHLHKCPKYSAGILRLCISDDKGISEWKTWWLRHCYLGLGILRAAKYTEDAMVIAGNPFRGTVFRNNDGGVITEKIAFNCQRRDITSCDGSTVYDWW